MTALIFIIAVFGVIGTTVALIVRGILAGKTSDAETQRLRQARKAQGTIEGLHVRALAAGDRIEWERHWNAYCSFYGEDLLPQTTNTTWSRILDPESPVRGWGAFDGSGNLVGFAHVVLHPHTWSPKTLAYLEDLFVAQSYRGRDVGHTLLTFLWRLAEERGWGRLYWHTETSNAAARRLYDRFRPADAYVRYTLTL